MSATARGRVDAGAGESSRASRGAAGAACRRPPPRRPAAPGGQARAASTPSGSAARSSSRERPPPLSRLVWSTTRTSHASSRTSSTRRTISPHPNCRACSVPARAHAARHLRIAQQHHKRVRHGDMVCRVDEQPGLAVAHRVERAAHGAGDHRQAVQPGLEEGDAEALARAACGEAARHGEDVGLRQEPVALLVRHLAGESERAVDSVRPREILKVAAQGPVPDHDPLGVRNAGAHQRQSPHDDVMALVALPEARDGDDARRVCAALVCLCPRRRAIDARRDHLHGLRPGTRGHRQLAPVLAEGDDAVRTARARIARASGAPAPPARTRTGRRAGAAHVPARRRRGW